MQRIELTPAAAGRGIRRMRPGQFPINVATDTWSSLNEHCPAGQACSTRSWSQIILMIRPPKDDKSLIVIKMLTTRIMGAAAAAVQAAASEQVSRQMVVGRASDSVAVFSCKSRRPQHPDVNAGQVAERAEVMPSGGAER